MPSAFDPTTTPGRMTTNVGVVSAIINGTRTPLGVTKGGADYMDDTKMRAAEFDGRRHIAIGTDEVVEYASKIRFTTVEFSDKVIGTFHPGATEVGGAITPIRAGVQITMGMMLLEPWFELTLKDGTILRYIFDAGLVTDLGPLNTKDKDEASRQVTLSARVDSTKPGYTTDDPDFTLVIVPAA